MDSIFFSLRESSPDRFGISWDALTGGVVAGLVVILGYLLSRRAEQRKALTERSSTRRFVGLAISALESPLSNQAIAYKKFAREVASGQPPPVFLLQVAGIPLEAVRSINESKLYEALVLDSAQPDVEIAFVEYLRRVDQIHDILRTATDHYVDFNKHYMTGWDGMRDAERQFHAFRSELITAMTQRQTKDMLEFYTEFDKIYKAWLAKPSTGSRAYSKYLFPFTFDLSRRMPGIEMAGRLQTISGAYMNSYIAWRRSRRIFSKFYSSYSQDLNTCYSALFDCTQILTR